MSVIWTSESWRRSRRCSRRAHSNPVKPLPTITTDVIGSFIPEGADYKRAQRLLRHAVPPRRMGSPMSRSLGLLSSVWSTATALPVSSGAAVAYRTLFMTIKRLVVGRTMTVRLDSADITLTVTEFDSRLDVRGLAVGQLNDVRIAATDIHWGDRSFEAATVVLHNVHLKPGVPPVLVAAPVEVTMAVSTHALD